MKCLKVKPFFFHNFLFQKILKLKNSKQLKILKIISESILFSWLPPAPVIGMLHSLVRSWSLRSRMPKSLILWRKSRSLLESRWKTVKRGKPRHIGIEMGWRSWNHTGMRRWKPLRRHSLMTWVRIWWKWWIRRLKWRKLGCIGIMVRRE